VCDIIGADIGLAAVNIGPDDTCVTAVLGDQVYERAIRFRGTDQHTQTWIATLALDLIRRMCLGLPPHT
jgi:hypothetical protein